MYFMWYSAYWVLIPGLLIAAYAQFKVNSAFNQFKIVANSRGISGADAARMILDANGLSDVRIGQIGGKLSDNYNPKNKTLNLSADVLRGRSIAAVSIAAHECGHAIQHKEDYAPVRIRTAMVPVVNIASMFSWVLIIAGFIFSIFNMTMIGIIFFSTTVVFQLVTLPVEFNASARALVQLRALGIANETEIYGAKKVLDAAALTYVAALIVAILQLLRLLLIFGRRN